MKPLILGSSGQLASHLRELLPGTAAWGRADLDLGSPETVAAAITEFAPTCIVNAAAYTAVDRAEVETETAWAINVTAVAEMARAAAKLGVPLIHISTDYVFSGKKPEPYLVDDDVAPINAYGRSKLGGELAVQSLCEQHFILRTSWVFSEHGSNFVKTMLRLAAERDTLRVVNDQFGVPTYAGDIARVVAALVAADSRPELPAGVYHAVGGPAVSWQSFAEQIIAGAREAGVIDSDVRVIGIPSSEYPTPAARPSNSRLSASPELAAVLGVPLDWQKGLDQMLKRLAPR